jgi:hypothetical protein
MFHSEPFFWVNDKAFCYEVTRAENDVSSFALIAKFSFKLKGYRLL